MFSRNHRFEKKLRQAGWYPGREADTSHWISWLENEGYEVHDAAAIFLAEYGGLIFTDSGPGITVGRDPFAVDPRQVGSECEIIEGWSEKLDKNIIPLGMTTQEMFEFGIDEDENMYIFSHACQFLGRGRDGLKALVLGIEGKIIE
ncbi:SUKH-3 domain-containing protein [Spirillospora sp. NPDC048819]|uniref:SUKH-3 domain-containing protein n=1 Tax=Spirillospora sp. NPDC048819 TaxID=3155268 RepID=UPI0034106C1F